jgi:hypothetical protein
MAGDKFHLAYEGNRRMLARVSSIHYKQILESNQNPTTVALVEKS